ncbi:MAG: cadherin-like beta sandwich domain-containing protein [Clostridia bacterium]|nr:cadherin-like beta sandwich domain-containing protein [Clostridia bacterium]
MKSTKKKVILSVCLAALFACIAVVSGVMLALNLNKHSKPDAVSTAATGPETLTTPAKMKLTTDRTSLTPGCSVTIHVSLSIVDTGVWYAAQSVLAPINEDGTINYELAQYFSIDQSSIKNPTIIAVEKGDYALISKLSSYTAEVSDWFNRYNSEDIATKQGTGIFFYISKSGSASLETNNDFEFEFVLKVSDSFPLDQYDSVSFGLSPAYTRNFFTTIPDDAHSSNQKDYTAQENTYSSNILSYAAKKANTEAEIDSIKIVVDVKGDPTTEEYVIEADDFVGGNYDLALPETSDLDLLVFYPKMKDGSENATVKAGATASQNGTPATLTELAQDGTEIKVSGTNRYLYIQATPEDGNTTNRKVYTVKLTFKYARLINLTATSEGFADTSITKYDLDLEPTNGEFDPDTFSYTAYVPEGTTDTTVTPTLAVDYGTSTSIRVVKDGAYQIVGNKVSVNNEAELYLRGIENGDKISFELTAQDGSTQTYDITFEIVTTDTSLKEVKATGNTSGKDIPNNEEKAEEEGKDYYFRVADTPAEAKLTITPNDENAKVEIKKVGSDEFEEFDPDKVYDLGEYIVKVTASAGNSKEYTLVLEKFDGFELKAGSDFALIALVEDTNTYGETVHYRRTYEELDWTHGIDDVNLERYVLGEIVAGTTLTALTNDFLKVDQICVYTADGTLIFDGANGGIVSGHADDLVCTSWKVVYGSGATADIIYVSVLGDVNGDGEITAKDSSDISTHIIKDTIRAFDFLEVQLAAYLSNEGAILAKDASNVSAIVIREDRTINEYLRVNQ